MLSAYFNLKTSTEIFKIELKNKFKDLEGKKVLIYGAGEGFLALKKMFDFSCLDIKAISDMKFTEQGVFEGYTAIPPSELKEEDYDVVLVTQERTKRIIDYLRNKLLFEKIQIVTIFKEEFPDESSNFEFLDKNNFKKNLEKLVKKLNNKKVVIYGAGVFFQLIHKYFDLSGLKIIAISDMKFDVHEKGETFLGYPVCSPNEIVDIKPDYVLVATRKYIDIAEDLHCYTLKDTGIKVRPLVKKNFLDMLKEIWDSEHAK